LTKFEKNDKIYKR